MELVQNLVVLAHLLGMAAIVGSAVFVARDRVTPALVWGSRMQVLTGIVLVGLAEALDDDVDHVKVGVKLVVGIAVAGCAEVAAGRSRRGAGSVVPLVRAAAGLALLATAVAVLWP
ncbi:MAG: hypothetical protein ACRCSN_04225 [Dermatophilaceae bacterium]